MNEQYVSVGDSGVQIGSELHAFLLDQALPITSIDAESFFAALSDSISRFAPRNKELLEVRADMQARIDQWHLDRRDAPHDLAEYRSFLEELGYLVPTGDNFAITTENVDDEISSVLSGTEQPSGYTCLLYTSPSPRDRQKSRMPSSA